jgi:uncharacterized membrane-anchored protein
LSVIGGFALVLIGVYMKKQEGLSKVQFITSVLVIVAAIVIYIVFGVIVTNVSDVT